MSSLNINRNYNIHIDDIIIAKSFFIRYKNNDNNIKNLNSEIPKLVKFIRHVYPQCPSNDYQIIEKWNDNIQLKKAFRYMIGFESDICYDFSIQHLIEILNVI